MARQVRAVLNSAGKAIALGWCACWMINVGSLHAQEVDASDDVLEVGDAAVEPSPAEPPPSQAEGPPPEAETPPPEADANEARFETSDEMRRLAEEADYAAAAALAERVLELSELEFGPGSELLADTYVEVADVQSRNGEYDEAEENALRAAEIYRDTQGPFSASLLAPYTVLGDNYRRRGDHLNAVSAYSEARTVSRRVYGLLNEGQIDILDRMTESFLDLNQFAEARAMQLEALTLIERSYDDYSPEALGALFKYAHWLRRNKRFTEERDQYFRAERLVREHYGEDSVMMVDILRERANSFRTQGAEDSVGIGSLKRALEILESQPEPEPLTLALLLRDMGDWQAAFTRTGIDGEDYRRSWELLGQVENGAQLREEWYEGTTIILTGELNMRGLSSNANDPMGFVLVHVDVDASGRTSNVVVVESDPPGFKDEAVARQIRQSRIRPRIVNGHIVESRHPLMVRFKYSADD